MADITYIISKIREAQQERGMPIAELARRAGMTPNALGESLRGNRMLTAEELVRLSAILGIELWSYIEPEFRQEVADRRKRFIEEFGPNGGGLA